MIIIPQFQQRKTIVYGYDSDSPGYRGRLCGFSVGHCLHGAHLFANMTKADSEPAQLHVPQLEVEAAVAHGI